ncbi:MAG: photosynthetic complex putative assembly protein PuhB [Gammaproteobacteria bacterium]|nr:photosynthetic complex putative assembly protein PuhB [Gammaproteobacteria bacterium]
MNEHESEPVRGLPEYLPQGERIVWQGEPEWRQLALRVFHLRKIAFYFAVLAAAHVALTLADGATPFAAAKGASWLLLLGAATIGLLGLLAWLYATTTIYTMTDRRLVMRFGVALPMMINIPWDKIDAADLKRDSDAHGSIVLTLTASRRMSYWLLWPHAKPWHFSPVQPMLRCIANPEDVALRLQQIVDGQHSAVVAPIRSAAPLGTGLTAGETGRPRAACS